MKRNALLSFFITVTVFSGYQYNPNALNLSDNRVKRCPNDFYLNTKLKTCSPCVCYKLGSENNICNYFGECNCRTGFEGPKCSSCTSGYYKDPLRKICSPCNCSEDGSKSKECDPNGQCYCKPGIGGKTCNRCLNLRMNFFHECTDYCPEMYDEIGKEFQKVLTRLDDLDEYLKEFSAEKKNFDKLAWNIRKLKEEVLSQPLISTSLKDLHNLLNMVETLQMDIRKYIKRQQDLVRLLNIIDEILGELAKITSGIVSSWDVCAKTCNKAGILQKERDDLLIRFKELQNKLKKAVEEKDNLERKVVKVRKEARFVKMWSDDIYNQTQSLVVPAFITNGVEEWDQIEFNSVMAKLDKLQGDIKMLEQMYKDVKVLEGPLLEVIVKSFKELVVNKYMFETSNIIIDTLQNVNSFHNSSTNIINALQPFKLKHNEYSDKLHRYQLELEKYIADDKLIKQTLHEILNVLNEILKRVREEDEIVREKKAAIATMKDETRKLERELVSIEKDITEGQKEVENLEEYLNNLLMIAHLREEVEKVKKYSEEIEGIDSNVCSGVSLN